MNFVIITGKVLGIKVEVINPENIPAKSPFLVVANHQGYADIYAMIELSARHRLVSFQNLRLRNSSHLQMLYVAPSRYLSTVAILVLL